MSDAVLLFTFSPIQPFITEARRAADLFTGSRILVELAKAAAQTIGPDRLVYPYPLSDDVPNRLVAIVPWESASDVASRAKDALIDRWQEIVQSADGKLASLVDASDATWRAIRDRQKDGFWEVYWASASMEGSGYKEAYQEASSALDGAKRLRGFEQKEESGLKDTLSGRRSALRTSEKDAKACWAEISRHFGPAKVRPNGRERLDTIGSVKRFCSIADMRFPSTSTVASGVFLNSARGHLSDYAKAVEELIGSDRLYKVREDPDWPYDGDLLFMESLSERHLQESFALEHADPIKLKNARSVLGETYKTVNSHPSPYYAVVILDGDDMGRHITGLLEKADPRKAHQDFSSKLDDFAGKVPGAVTGRGRVVYNGGDDVLALFPLEHFLAVSKDLAELFAKETGRTASAGVAVVHRLSPLDAALRAARDAERQAKHVPGKSAVCVRVLRRSGEETRMVSAWEDIGDCFAKLVSFFREGKLSSRFAYDILEEARTVTGLADHEARTATLRRLVKRHKSKAMSPAEEEEQVVALRKWADSLDKRVPSKSGAPQGFLELGKWLVLSRFVAQGGTD